MRRAVVFNDTRVDRHHGCTSVMNTISRLCADNDIDILCFVPAHAPWRTADGLGDVMAAADLVIVNGEGTIHHDRPAGKRLLELAEYARDNRCASALINATWAENSPALAQMARGFDLVSVRETVSQAELAQHGVAARVIPDLALYEQHGSATRSGIGVTDNVVAATSVALHQRMTRLGARPISLLYGRTSAMTVARNLRRYQLNPQVRALGWGAMFRAVFDEWRVQTEDREAFIKALSELELVVTGRFHAMILSLATQTPVIAVPSNTHKNAATLLDAGLEAWRAPDKVDDIDASLLERARQWSPQEAKALQSWLDHSRAAMEALFSDIARLSVPGVAVPDHVRPV